MYVRDFESTPMLNNFKAASGKTYENELSIVCDFYEKDFDRDDLQSQLRVFNSLHALGRCIGPRSF